MSASNADVSIERSSLVSSEAPWPGLAPFTEEQSGFFHGRDEEIRALTRLMERKALTVLFGQSGLGKSSLLQAGVFPRLRAAGFCPIYIRLDHSEGAPPPAEQVKAMVQAESARVGKWTKAGAAKPGESLWEFFHHRDDRLIDANGRAIVPVLVFDQFEELFTLGASLGAQRDRAVAFMSDLAELVENRPSEKLVERLDQSADEMDAFDFSRTDYRVCISLREDYLPHLEGLKTIMPALMENRMRLTRMTGMQALDAVLKPGGALVTPEVARAIVEFVSGARGGSVERLAELDVEPPLLSVICHELNERRRQLGQPQITADLVTGNRREILNDFYERSVSDLPEGVRRFVEDKLLTKSGYRDNLALETALEEPGVTKPLIDTLVSRRLLRLEDRIGVQRVELTHDVLADVVRASRDTRQQRLLLEEAKRREAQALAETARRTRRMRWIISGLAAAVVVLLIGAFFGLRAQRRAAEAAARVDLAAGSRLLDEGKIGDGLAHIVRAAQREPAIGAVASTRILSTLSARTFVLPSGAAMRLPAATDSIYYLPGGKSALALGEDGVVRLIDAVEWKLSREYRFDKKVASDGVRVAARNAEIFAVAFDDGTVSVCEVATGRLRFPPLTPPARAGEYSQWLTSQKITPPWSFGLSADGRWLRTIRHSWTVFDAATGEERYAGDLWSMLFDGVTAFDHFSPVSDRMITSGGTVTGIPGSWQLLTGSMDVRSVPDGKVIATVPAHQGVNARFRQSAMFSADGSRFLVVGDPFTGSRTSAIVYVCDSTALTPAGPLISFDRNQISQVVLTPDGKRVVLAGNDRTVTVYDVSTGKAAYAALKHGGPATLVGISADSTILATTAADGLCRLWDLRTGVLAAESTYKQDRASPAALSADGRTLLLTTPSGLLHRLQITRGPAAPLVLPSRAPAPNIPAAPLLAQFTGATPARLAWVTSSEVRILDVSSGRWTTGGFPLPFFVNPNTALLRASHATALRAGDTLIARPNQGPRQAWVMGDNAVAKTITLEGLAATNLGTIVLSENGRRATMRQTGSPGLTVWDVHTGRNIATLREPNTVPTTFVAFSPDDRRIAVMEQKTDEMPEGFRVYDLASGKSLYRLVTDDKSVFRVARFTPDSTQLLTGNSWGKVQVWDAATGRAVRSTQAHGFAVNRFDFSADGQRYASLSQEGTVQVWAMATHQPVGAALEHATSVIRSAFSADNTRLTTLVLDGMVRAWDLATGLPVAEIAQGVSIGTLAHSADGRFILTSLGGSSPSQRIFSAPPVGRPGRAPKWLLQLATICAARRLNDDGRLVAAAEEFDRLDELRQEIAALPADEPYAAWARWFLSQDSARPIAPGFTLTADEAQKLTAELAAPDPLIAMTTRDDALLLQRKYAETEPIEREMLAWVRKRDGEDGPYLHSHLVKLAQSLIMNGKFEEGEKFARESLALREKNNPKDSYPVQSARATIGSALVGQKRYAEAEPLLAEAAEFFKRQGPQNELTTNQVVNRVASLVALYEATNRPDKAAEWKTWTPPKPAAAQP